MNLNHKALFIITATMGCLSCLILPSILIGELVLLKYKFFHAAILFIIFTIIFVYMIKKIKISKSDNDKSTVQCDCPDICVVQNSASIDNGDAEGPYDLDIGCKADVQEQISGLQGFRKLMQHKLIDTKRNTGTLVLTFKLEAEEEIFQFIEGESECCSHLKFDVLLDKETLDLSIQASESSLDTLETLLQR